MKKDKKIISLALAAALVFSLAGCGSSNGETESVAAVEENSLTGESAETAEEGSTSSEQNVELKEIRIASPTADATALVENAGIALKLGYLDEELEKAGYKATYVGFGQGGTAINEAFASKQIDVAFVGDIPLIIGKSNNLNIELFASLNSEAELGIVVGANSGIESVADLKGKKVVAAFGTVTYVYLYKLLEANGLSINDVEVINDIANGATLVATGDADAVVSTGAGIYQFEANGIGTILTSSNEDTSLSAQFFAAGDKDFLSENSDAAKAIVRALNRAENEFTENTQDTYNAIADENYSVELWNKIYPEEYGFEKFAPYLADSYKEKFNETAQILLDSSVITNPVSVDDFFDNTYTGAVYEELGLEIPE